MNSHNYVSRWLKLNLYPFLEDQGWMRPSQKLTRMGYQIVMDKTWDLIGEDFSRLYRQHNDEEAVLEMFLNEHHNHVMNQILQFLLGYAQGNLPPLVSYRGHQPLPMYTLPAKSVIGKLHPVLFYERPFCFFVPFFFTRVRLYNVTCETGFDVLSRVYIGIVSTNILFVLIVLNDIRELISDVRV